MYKERGPFKSGRTKRGSRNARRDPPPKPVEKYYSIGVIGKGNKFVLRSNLLLASKLSELVLNGPTNRPVYSFEGLEVNNSLQNENQGHTGIEVRYNPLDLDLKKKKR